MDEKYISPLQPAYIFKIFLGLIAVAGVMVVAYALGLSGLSPIARYIVLGVLLIIASAIVPFAKRIYSKMDELRKLQHQTACVASLPLIAAIAAIVGMLQFSGLIPAFNQFWMFGLVLAVWATNLMLADRPYH
jgi:hypothetical protein